MDLGRNAAMSADEAREAGLDPFTFRSIALDTGAGANLLAVAPLPPTFSYTSLEVYEKCPLKYAFKYVYRMPQPDRPSGALTFGTTAHEAFEAFTRERRDRAARGEPPPTKEDLERLFRDRWVPAKFGDTATEESFERKVDNLLDNFWTGELAGVGEAVAEELPFTLVLDPGDGSEPVRVYGEIDRIDRLPGRRPRGRRLQDRQGQQPEGRRREPAAHHLRAGLPGRAGPGHAREGDAVLHRSRRPG